MFSFHLARVSPLTGGRALARGALVSGLRGPVVPGLIHSEVMAGMRLGAPVVSPDRLQVRDLMVCAQWEDESALEEFLAAEALGRTLSRGWHVRLEFVRRWGAAQPFDQLPEIAGRLSPGEPVVAVTLARTRLGELPRFIRWGRPVERQVRDDPATTLALAGVRPPRTFSTFSIWRSSREMTAMVFGRGDRDPDQVRRHVEAMGERDRRDFHREFTTMRFRPLSEHGSWRGHHGYVRPAPTVPQ